MGRKRVLLVTHAFPPGGSVEVDRISKFAKYLPEFGWDVFVLTTSSNTVEANKEAYPFIDNLERINRTRLLRSDISMVNDDGLRWLPTAAHQIVSMVKKHNIDAVLHTGPVFLPFMSIGYVKQRLSVPYILDFRDPWADLRGDHNNESIKAKIYSRLSSVCEPYIFKKADAIIANTDQMNEYYSNLYTSENSKIFTIYNGYDQDDLQQLRNSTTEREHLQLIYPGKFRDDMDYFFRAIRSFSEDVSDIRFDHYGRTDIERVSEVSQIVHSLELDDQVNFKGYVDKKEVLSSILAADVGIAVTRPGDNTHVPAKLFDYIACDIPVICVDEENGAARSLLSQFEHTYVVGRGETKAIRAALEEIHEKDITSIGSPSAREKYTRRSQAERLSNILSDTLNA